MEDNPKVKWQDYVSIVIAVFSVGVAYQKTMQTQIDLQSHIQHPDYHNNMNKNNEDKYVRKVDMEKDLKIAINEILLILKDIQSKQALLELGQRNGKK